MKLSLGPASGVDLETVRRLLSRGVAHPSMSTYAIDPTPKPRMTQRDKWAKRPCVLRYRAFKDLVLFARVALPLSYHVIFVLQTHLADLWGQPHRKKPDRDNLEKALLDAVTKDDSGYASAVVEKVWGEQGLILIGNYDNKTNQSAINRNVPD